jgi:hypothetical protein
MVLSAKEANREEVFEHRATVANPCRFPWLLRSKNACEVSPTGICYENTQPLGREILEITF